MHRLLSGAERLWLVANAVEGPFVNTLVIEGRGHLTTIEVERAVERAAVAAPGLAARVVGRLGRTRWDDGPHAAVRRVDGALWTGRDPDGAPWLGRALDPRDGPSAEVVLVTGSPSRVVVRTHHALADGRGTLAMVACLFAALRGERPAEAPDGPHRDVDLIGRWRAERTPTSDCAPATGPRGGDGRSRWGRRSVVARPGSVTARVAVALARHARHLDGEGTLRIDVPVDLRAAAPHRATTGNLTGLVRLDVGALLGGRDPVAAVASALRDHVHGGDAAAFIGAVEGLRRLPVSLLVAMGRRAVHARRRSGRYSTTATVSNLGRLDLGGLSGGGFVADTAFFVPPASPGVPLFVALTGCGDVIEVVGTAPGPLVAGLDAALDTIAAALQA